MRNFICIFAVAILIFGCAINPAFKPEFSEQVKNSRIVYRDLTEPVKYKVPITDGQSFQTKGRVPVKQVSETKGHQPQHFISFKNESCTTYDNNELKAFLASGKKSAHIFIVGHSHGKSRVGTLKLASQRASTIKAALVKNGFENVYVMASWGDHPTGFSPGRGVQLYSIGAIDEQKGTPLVFVKKTEDKNNVKHPEKDPERYRAPDRQPADHLVGHVQGGVRDHVFNDVVIAKKE